MSRLEVEKQKRYEKADKRPPQEQPRQPGLQGPMKPQPIVDDEHYRPAGKLQDQVALITGGDSGIGQAVAIIFAKEGARVAINFLSEETEDAKKTKQLVEKYGGQCLLLPGDLRETETCNHIVEATVKQFGKLDILVNNAAYQMVQEKLEDITDEQWERTLVTNVYAPFRVTRAALGHMKDGSNIIFTTSVVAARGSKHLIDYSVTKGALQTFMRSLAQNLADRKIRVNSVAPGPVWTPFIPSSFPADKVESFGEDTYLGRASQPCEIAPAYVFLACADATSITGHTIHVDAGAPTKD